MRELNFNPIVVWGYNRVKKNKNAIIIINGGTGSGKTYAGIRLAYELSKKRACNFTVEDNISFNFASLIRNTNKTKNKRPGTVFLFEEVGAVGSGSSSKDWQSKQNKYFNTFLQTIRHRRQIFIMTCPMFTFLEKASRSLVHMQIDMAPIDFAKKISYIKPYLVQINTRSGKFYFKNMRVRSGAARVKMRYLAVKIPPEDILIEYEKRKEAYTDNLKKEILKLDKPEEVKKPEKKYKVDINKAMALISTGLNRVQVARELNVTTKTLRKAICRLQLAQLKDNVGAKVPTVPDMRRKDGQFTPI